MLICRNAEGVHGKRKVGNPWSKSMFPTFSLMGTKSRHMTLFESRTSD